MRIVIPIELLAGFLLIGLVAGFLAEQILREERGQSLLVNLVVGVMGSVVGGLLFLLLSFHGLIGALISALAGAVTLLLLVILVKPVLFPRQSGWLGWKNWSRSLGRH